MARDITVHFVGNARDLAASSAVAGASVDRFGNQVAFAGAKAEASSIGFSSLLVPIIALSLALAPAISLLTAFAVGLTAVLTVVTVAVGGFLALGAGLVALAAVTGQLGDITGKGAASANEMAKAQDDLNQAIRKYGADSYQAGLAQERLTKLQQQGRGPIQALREHFEDAAKAIVEQAAPAISLMLGFVDELIGPVQQLGSEFVEWFGNQLPAVLDVVQSAVGPTADILRSLGRGFASFTEQVIAAMPTFGPIVAATFQFLVDTFLGLLHALLELGNWFAERLPVLGPEVAQIMGAIGIAFGGLMTVAGIVVDFFIAHWPQIASSAQSVFDQIATGVRFVAPLLGLVGAMFEALGPVIQFVRDHADSLKPVLYAVGGLLVVMAASAALTVAALLLIVAAITAVAAGMSFAIAHINAVADAFWAVVHAAQAAASAVGRVRDEVASIPVIGGALHIANIPGFQEGGVVPGPIGAPMLAMVHGGETVIPAGRGAGTVNNYYTINVPLGANKADVGREVVQAIQEYERRGSRAWRQ